MRLVAACVRAVLATVPVRQADQAPAVPADVLAEIDRTFDEFRLDAPPTARRDGCTRPASQPRGDVFATGTDAVRS